MGLGVENTGWMIALDGQRGPAMVAPLCETSHGRGFLVPGDWPLRASFARPPEGPDRPPGYHCGHRRRPDPPEGVNTLSGPIPVVWPEWERLQMNVFISYRRKDSQYIADRIYDWLERE